MDSPYAYAAPVQASLGAPLLAPPLVPAAVATMPAPQKKTVARPGTGPKKPKRPKTAYHFFFDAERKAALDAAPDRDKVDNNMLSRQLGTIPASRGAAVPSRHRRDSSPGMMEVGGLFFDFEPRRDRDSRRPALEGHGRQRKAPVGRARQGRQGGLRRSCEVI